MLISNTYPFTNAPDIETSSTAYDLRFVGPIGQWFIQVQKDALLKVIRAGDNRTVLDVGGGHAQTAIPLVEEGYDVTVLGSSAECSRKLNTLIEQHKCKFQVGQVLKLPFPDKSFDTVIAFRLISHIENWQLLISELCRVAKNNVIIDFPQKFSFNALMPVLFGTKRRIEKNTRFFLVFEKSEIRKEFIKNGFLCAETIPQYFFPMVLHRFMKNPKISAVLEKVARSLKLHKVLGSPIVGGYNRVR